MTALGLVGGALAVSRTTGTEWQVKALSRLGVDQGARTILTATLLGMGFILLALAMSLNRSFGTLRSAGRLTATAAWLLTIGFVAAGVAMAVVALFPIWGSTSTIVHNIAGFTIPIVLMATIVGARLAIGSLGMNFDRFSFVVTLGVIVLFAAATWVRLLPYGLMELICFAMIGAWLWLFEARLRTLLAGL
jgi:hypothetical protein